MTNYLEEQNNELEALESIYANEFSIIEKEPFPKFTIKLTTDDYEDNEVKLTATIEFTFVEKYPDELPLIEIIEYEDNFIEEYKEELIKLLNDEANKNLNMVMIFTLVSIANEWMTNKVEELKKEIKLEKERKLKEHEEIEQKKFEGTKVTLDSFMEWKRKYEEEIGKAAKERAEKEKNKKLTGRQLFERDSSLAKSDLKFADEDVVAVDESLFQDLDDLDLDDEDDSEFDPDDMSDSD